MHLISRLILCFTLLFSCLAVGCGGSGSEAELSSEIEGQLIDLKPGEINDLDTESRNISLSKMKGKVVILNFWGSWCGPCRYETPDLVRMHQELNGKGLEVLAVNYGDERESALAFMNKNQVRYSVIFDKGYTDLFEVGSFPTNIVIDRRGRIRYRLEGFSPRAMELLREIVEHLLAQQA
jgi:cytochrome c biogenesis protein CcmG, thiol:disulfide interchange protein DsbE